MVACLCRRTMRAQTKRVFYHLAVLHNGERSVSARDLGRDHAEEKHFPRRDAAAPAPRIPRPRLGTPPRRADNYKLLLMYQPVNGIESRKIIKPVIKIDNYSDFTTKKSVVLPPFDQFFHRKKIKSLGFLKTYELSACS